MKNLQVQKMLSPEETQLLGTLQSTITELLSLQNANGEAAPEGGEGDIMEALKQLAGQNDGAEDTTNDNMQAAQKENNGPTANENAEQRSEAETDVNDKNISEVGKMLMGLLSRNNQAVTKSYTPVNQGSINPDVIAQAIAKSLQPVVTEISQMKQFNSNLIDALGFSNKIEKSLPSLHNVNKSQTPVQSVDAAGVVNELVSVIKSLSNNNQNREQPLNNDWNGRQDVRKNLKEALPQIFQNSINK